MRRHQHVDTPEELTPEQLDGLINAVQHVCRQGIDERLGVFGTSTVQCRALQLIRDNPGVSQRRLARLMGQSGQAFGTLVTRLYMQRFLVGSKAPGPTGVVTHELTPVGRFMLEDAQEIAHGVLAMLFMPLTAEDRQSLRALLEKVLKARWRLQFHPMPECP